MCWKLKRCLYGTRDAPARWEALYISRLQEMGFAVGTASANCFYNANLDIRCVVHGDDFTFSGEPHALAQVQRQMQQAFLCKVEGILGSDEGDLKQARILNRIVTWNEWGLQYEADPRHAEILVRELGVTEKEAVVTPGVKWKPEEVEASQPLDGPRASQFRALAARANYLGLDRVDIAYAAKECCRRMTDPRDIDWGALRRIARYLRGKPRLVYKFRWQSAGVLTAYVDTDFAGCLVTRRSTSGGALLYGSHLVKHWSTTQKTTALSSGEAELYGVVKGASEALGLQSIAEDMGIKAEVHIRTDSSAAIGICNRTGIGKVRHLATGQLWVQERIRNHAFRLFKHPGAENPGDICTKHVPSELLKTHLPTTSVEYEDGRAACAPEITEKRGTMSR